MKFKFKIQPYQTAAVESTVNVFAGQPLRDGFQYRRDLGKRDGQIVHEEDYAGFRNNEVEISDADLLKNIKDIQSKHDIPLSASLSKIAGLGAVNLDIEMETGTGKTYVYIKTMFELNKRYGWSKFIIVVPSIAIREGVEKSFSYLEDHFMEHYGKKARHFVYNSSNLQQLDAFSSDAGINVMIINTQAFATSMKEGANNKESRIIYSERDEFASRRPIDVISANHPVIIMDEPQKMEGEATQKALKNFKPLFMLYYSATHKTPHNCIYALDPLDAYKQKLVKSIEVKGFEMKNLKGTGSYMYLDQIILSTNKPPVAKIELEVKGATAIRRESHKFNVGDSLYEYSNLNEYKGFTISDIDPINNTVSFTNGEKIRLGEVIGDSSELVMQRIQIRETIASHFEKERDLFKKGIKTLSLFFIDEVAHYKSYDSDGNEVKGPFWTIFEEEYKNALNDNMSAFEDDYQEYLRQFKAEDVHRGYFSIDKGRAVNSKTGRGSEFSDDISAYELILKNKERLLSFEEPTRFIFSHSALREGWDNPNVFQICTLRHAKSDVARRQEVGRGLRLCVDSTGSRMDYEVLGEDVHDINKLTVIANESYSDFVKGFQDDTRKELRVRPTKADINFFRDKTVKDINGNDVVITENIASLILSYLYDNDYIDDTNKVTDQYKQDQANNTLEPMGKKLRDIEPEVHKLVQSIFDESVIIEDMIENGHQTQIPENKLNSNWDKKEFQKLWNEISYKYAYTVQYDSNELIENAIKALDAKLFVNQLSYVKVVGQQHGADEFGNEKSSTNKIQEAVTSSATYDVVGEIAKGATLTRKTVAAILRGISPKKLYLFRNNPEEFIKNVCHIISEQKATMIVEHIQYNRLTDRYESDIFTREKSSQPISKAFRGKKSVQDYVYTDGSAERSIERVFAEDLEAATEVAVYAKLPRSFQIPTPVGNYAPDWAIAFNDSADVKHIFFVAETKGNADSMQLKKIEDAKIECAKKLFNDKVNTPNVRYWAVASYRELLDVMKNID